MPRLMERGSLKPVDRLTMRKVLRDAFKTPPRMKDLLLAINRDFDDYYGMGDDYPEAVQKLVDRANEELWWMELLAAAHTARPTDPLLAEFAAEFNLAPIPVETTARGTERIPAGDLEAKVRAANPMLDVLVWRTRLGEIEGRVCRVECPPGKARGTGFLVGPDVVITNYHVVKDVIDGTWAPEHVLLRFDYKVLSDGVKLGEDKTYSLAADWLIDHSPYSAHDLEAIPTGEPAVDELDYALMRTAGAPGREPLFPGDPNSAARGWIEVPPGRAELDFGRQKALFIVQHPDGKPMQVALDTDSITGVFGNQTRLRYRTNTEGGSSGSPCFGPDWQWIALHHSGDPMYGGPQYPARWNQGILVSAIVNLLEQRGKLVALGSR